MVAWFLPSSLRRGEGSRAKLLLLAVGCRTDDRTSLRGRQMETGPQRTTQTPAAWLQKVYRVGNSRPVGIWDTSLVVFCREEKNHTLLLGSMGEKKRAVFFSSHLAVFLSPLNLKKGTITQHILDLVLGSLESNFGEYATS